MSNNSQQQASSVSPSSRRTFSERISAVGAKINRALSSEGGRSSQPGYDPETESIASTLVDGQDRSSSRNRDIHSSGRGGAGNFYANASGHANGPGDVQEFPWPRGRERAPVRAAPAPVAPIIRSTGRGGSGNFSQSPPAADPSYSIRDREILRAHAETEKSNIRRSSGRGGMGNMVSTDTAARSRSRSVDPVTSPTAMRANLPTGYSPSPSRDRADPNGNINGYGHGRRGGNGQT
ncbi:hypothetical protein C8F04DRAFT_1117917 [Mycena alexandri]|uniref:Uncharacterized protein n=1 Tax=Mycena alexandri TaxID=1745969 RepID=A0AAD6SJH9_9AGAR|nr:hypothetical protein C8F04DRAFT_106419 [Mycena alexandri]KAJ7028943.1 hypothetical protein C8F04DRAFT_1117917 [Mycena alexandri]